MPRLAEFRPDLPRGLIAAVQQAVALEPDSRQDSVAEFRAQLIGKQRDLSRRRAQERRSLGQFEQNCREPRRAPSLRMGRSDPVTDRYAETRERYQNYARAALSSARQPTTTRSEMSTNATTEMPSAAR